MTTVQDVLAAAARLSPVEQLEIIQVLSRKLQNVSSNSVLPTQRRIPGLDAGPVWMSDDFDAELPDSFWFGSDDEASA